MELRRFKIAIFEVILADYCIRKLTRLSFACDGSEVKAVTPTAVPTPKAIGSHEFALRTSSFLLQ
jgi:hypothetical protein